MAGMFKIIRIDNIIVRKVNLEVGVNVIENDLDPGAKDELQAGKGAEINLLPSGEMFLTPMEGVSCYLRSHETLKWKLLKENTSVSIGPDDICLLYPLKIWLRVISAADSIDENTSSKRKLEEESRNAEPSDKKCCTENFMETKPMINSLSDNKTPSPIVTSFNNNVDDKTSNILVNEKIPLVLNTEVSEDNENSKLQLDDKTDLSDKKCSEDFMEAKSMISNLSNDETSLSIKTSCVTNEDEMFSNLIDEKNSISPNADFTNDILEKNENHKLQLDNKIDRGGGKTVEKTHSPSLSYSSKSLPEFTDENIRQSELCVKPSKTEMKKKVSSPELQKLEIKNNENKPENIPIKDLKNNESHLDKNNKTLVASEKVSKNIKIREKCKEKVIKKIDSRKSLNSDLKNTNSSGFKQQIKSNIKKKSKKNKVAREKVLTNLRIKGKCKEKSIKNTDIVQLVSSNSGKIKNVELKRVTKNNFMKNDTTNVASEKVIRNTDSAQSVSSISKNVKSNKQKQQAKSSLIKNDESKIVHEKVIKNTESAPSVSSNTKNIKNIEQKSSPEESLNKKEKTKIVREKILKNTESAQLVSNNSKNIKNIELKSPPKDSSSKKEKNKIVQEKIIKNTESAPAVPNNSKNMKSIEQKPLPQIPLIKNDMTKVATEKFLTNCKEKVIKNGDISQSTSSNIKNAKSIELKPFTQNNLKKNDKIKVAQEKVTNCKIGEKFKEKVIKNADISPLVTLEKSSIRKKQDKKINNDEKPSSDSSSTNLKTINKSEKKVKFISSNHVINKANINKKNVKNINKKNDTKATTSQNSTNRKDLVKIYHDNSPKSNETKPAASKLIASSAISRKYREKNPVFTAWLKSTKNLETKAKNDQHKSNTTSANAIAEKSSNNEVRSLHAKHDKNKNNQISPANAITGKNSNNIVKSVHTKHDKNRNSLVSSTNAIPSKSCNNEVKPLHTQHDKNRNSLVSSTSAIPAKSYNNDVLCVYTKHDKNKTFPNSSANAITAKNCNNEVKRSHAKNVFPDTTKNHSCLKSCLKRNLKSKINTGPAKMNLNCKNSIKKNLKNELNTCRLHVKHQPKPNMSEVVNCRIDETKLKCCKKNLQRLINLKCLNRKHRSASRCGTPLLMPWRSESIRGSRIIKLKTGSGSKLSGPLHNKRR